MGQNPDPLDVEFHFWENLWNFLEIQILKLLIKQKNLQEKASQTKF